MGLAQMVLYGLQARQISEKGNKMEASVIYTHYDYLDLAPGASTARIEAAYAQMLERFGYGGADMEQDMGGLVRMIHAAYEVLSDPQQRRRYDEELAREAALADAELKSVLDLPSGGMAQRFQDAPAALQQMLRQLAA
jgi:DnaJ-class molecular chaperone